MVNMEQGDTNSSYSPAVSTGNRIRCEDVVLLIANLLAIAANVIILFIILKYKFRKENTYIFILHWSILDIIRLLTSPGIVEWHTRIDKFFGDFRLRKSYIALSIAFQMGIAMLLLVLMVKDGIVLLKSYCKTLIYFIWAVVVTFSFMAILGGFQQLEFLHGSMIFSVAVYVVLLVMVFVICIVSFAKQTYSGGTFLKLKLVMVSVYACYWLLFIMIVALYVITLGYFGYFAYGTGSLCLMFYALAESNALVNVYVLQKIDPRFRQYLLQAFCCKKHVSQSDVNCAYDVHANDNDTV